MKDKQPRMICIEQMVAIAPDGGWGWMVVMAAFFAHVITHGILYSFGILFITLQETFNGSKADIAWINALATGTLYLIGPMAAYMSDRFGCRVVTALGTVIGTTGYVISMFVNSLPVLYITLGVVVGGGFGMVFLPAIVIVTQYFQAYRTVACGMALSGAGVGAFIFSPLLKYLLEHFSLRGTFLILAGIILNCIPCGIIFRPMRKVRLIRDIIETNNKDTQLGALDIQSNGGKIETFEIHGKTCINGDYEKELSLLNATKTHYVDENCERINDEFERELPLLNETKIDSVDENHKNMFEKKTGDSNTIFVKYITLLKDSSFLVFGSSQFLFFLGYYLPYIYIPDKAKLLGIPPSDAVWVVSAMGISGIIGRVVIGYIADKYPVYRLAIFQCALLTAGVSTCFGPVYNSLWSMYVYALLFGISTGTTLSFTSVVLADNLGLDRLTEAFGMTNFLTGIASLLGPPCAGLLFDMTGNYNASFVAAGVAVTTGGLLMLCIRCTRHKE